MIRHKEQNGKMKKLSRTSKMFLATMAAIVVTVCIAGATSCHTDVP
jgi:cell division protein FtsL